MPPPSLSFALGPRQTERSGLSSSSSFGFLVAVVFSLHSGSFGREEEEAGTHSSSSFAAFMNGDRGRLRLEEGSPPPPPLSPSKPPPPSGEESLEKGGETKKMMRRKRSPPRWS